MELKDKTSDVRYLNDMRDVLYDKQWAETAPNLELYYMYRQLTEKDGIKYDITIIPAQMLGKEFTKTKGHEHVGSYPEIYTVLEGEAIYFMQKQKDDVIEDVYAVKAKKGDVVIIPSYYAHVTINPSGQDLKMANWMAIEAKSDYSPIQKKGGVCYFYTTSGWIKNENYKQVPELRFEKPKKEVPKDLSFLKARKKYE
ncbi:glucose-6-phosphate isomerase [Patescibacteria group bacterium]|nr:glucose-6-phosphate isomerase [Patescibacteria group bacterium]